MTSIRLFDPESDSDQHPAQILFNAIIEQAKEQNLDIARISLEQLTDDAVRALVEQGGQDVLPVTLVDGQLVLAGCYPSLADLKRWDAAEWTSRYFTCVKTLPVVWQRLVNAEGRTCPRCHATGDAIQHALVRLKTILAPFGIQSELKTIALNETFFRTQPDESNCIWIAGKMLEEWLDARTGSSRCCDECGESDCRTVEVNGSIYEAIPGELLVRAGVTAATRQSDPTLMSSLSVN